MNELKITNLHCAATPKSKDLNYIVAEAEILYILVLFRVVYLSVYYFTQKIILLKFME